MEGEEFARVYEAFRAFHACFAPAFGRKQWREHSAQYLHALLVQSEERRNAENLAEVVPVSPRALQRFLTQARWDDEAVIARLQAYLGPRLTDPLAIWVVDGSDFPKQGTKSVGVARQYCGALGKVANCQAGVFLAYVGPKGRALVDKRLYLPQGWTGDPERCAAAGVPEPKQRYQAKTDLALAMLRQARAWGHLRAEWVAGDDAFGMSPAFRDGLAAQGLRFVLDVPPATPVWPLHPTWTSPASRGHGPRPKPKPRDEERRTVEQRSLALPKEAWREVTVAEGAQGPREYRFSAERVRETRDGQPGGVLWAVYRQNLDGSEPRYYVSNAPEDTPLATLARVGGSRWPIETEFETAKSDVGLDEYETRTWAGWHHHITLCLLAGAFLVSLQQDWGEKDAAAHAPAGVPGGAGGIAPEAVRAGGATAVAGGRAMAQRAGEALARETARRPPPGGQRRSTVK
jgi:SRSO17 transposase